MEPENYGNMEKMIMEAMEKWFKSAVKNFLESIMLEEREIYLEEHDTKANGFYTRDLLTLFGCVENLKVPRVREGDFHPAILPYKRKISFDLGSVILLLFSIGISMRKIAKILESIYEIFYSPQSISRLVKVAEDRLRAWKERKLNSEYYAIYLDAIFVSLRREKVSKEPIYIALGVLPDGKREILGFWIFGAEGESSGNWGEVLRDIKRRGVEKVKIFISDDVVGMEEVIKREFPDADFQICVFHTMKNISNQVRKEDRGMIREDFKKVYSSDDKESAMIEFERFKRRWYKKYPRLVERLERKIELLLAFMKHPKVIREHIRTTNMIERLNRDIRDRVRIFGVFHNELSAESLLYLILSQLNETRYALKLSNFTKVKEENYEV